MKLKGRGRGTRENSVEQTIYNAEWEGWQDLAGISYTQKETTLQIFSIHFCGYWRREDSEKKTPDFNCVGAQNVRVSPVTQWCLCLHTGNNAQKENWELYFACLIGKLVSRGNCAVIQVSLENPASQNLRQRRSTGIGACLSIGESTSRVKDKTILKVQGHWLYFGHKKFG